ncbi:flavodoxin family protein [Ramlibacter sp. AN1015]|uniref:flavodoxin family protein n=1 Tax=Ramlibacter sp. AN1015 TaxID=3133428 RepID=UPI0030C5869C
MQRIALIYHSAHGHTEHIATQVLRGASELAGIRAELLRAEDLASAPEALVAYDGLVFGSPTYLGGVSGTFKTFMDATGRMWRQQQLRGKLAAGFTVSSLPAGDKQSTLMSMFVFAMQHGMLWMGNPILPEQHAGVPYEQAANRLGSWSGLMAQAGHASPADAFAAGDIKTARMFGAHFARALQRLGASDVSAQPGVGTRNQAEQAEAA